MSRKAKEILVNEETKTIPISDPFTPEFEREREAWIQKNQRPREFISNESSLKDKKAFDRGYAISKPLVEVEEDISKLCKGASRSRRKHLRDRQHQLGIQITLGKKQTAIDGRRPINARCLEYFRQKGVPENIRDFINWLKQERVLDKTNKWGRSFKISETTVRDILHNTFGITGKPGRKPR
jgi:hypothetical protein